MLLSSFAKIESLTDIKSEERRIIFSPCVNNVDVPGNSIIFKVGLNL